MDEVRRVRQEYSAEFDYNVRAMAEDLQKCRQQYADRLVSFPPGLFSTNRQPDIRVYPKNMSSI
jgi:hypothetical protein